MADIETPPPFRDFFRTFAVIGLTSFGGPAGQIALMHKEIVADRGWIDEDHYLHALNFCHLLPGPEAQQLATYIGWRLHGVKGGLAAGLLFVIPGALVILGLSILYSFAAGLGWFEALFLGVKAAVLAIVVQALVRIAGRALNSRLKQGLALTAFIALFLFNLPFPLVVLSAAALGAIVARTHPERLRVKSMSGDVPAAQPGLWLQTARTIVIWAAIWAAPMLLILLTLGSDHILWQIGAFFSKLAVVTFGGAYAVLAYMAQETVQSLGWLKPGEMADGLGLAETTPGPLIMVTQFVGYLAAFRAPAPFTPLIAGLIGAGVTTWVTFAPCFLWIFALAPWIDRLRHAKLLGGALAAITAAVVGVIANLTLWFALHVLFNRMQSPRVPEWASLSVPALLLAALAGLLLFRFKQTVMRTLAIVATAGLVIGQIGG
jgi:chromate transporter